LRQSAGPIGSSPLATYKPVVLVSWISQTFLQLVLLSVIIVGQNVLAAAADRRAEATYNDADAVLHEAMKIQEHLLAQDKVLGNMIGKLDAPGVKTLRWSHSPAFSSVRRR
jgi:hypothetical protein